MIPSLSPLADALRPRRAPAVAGMPVEGNKQIVDPNNIGGETPNGDARGQAKDLRSFDSFGDYLQDPTVQKEWGDIARAAMGAISPAGTVARGGLTAAGVLSGPMALGGMEGPGIGGGGGISAADLGASLAEGSSTPGMFYDGGVVQPHDMRGPNPPGPDQGYVAVHAGEMILNKPQQSALMQALRGRR